MIGLSPFKQGWRHLLAADEIDPSKSPNSELWAEELAVTVAYGPAPDALAEPVPFEAEQ